MRMLSPTLLLLLLCGWVATSAQGVPPNQQDAPAKPRKAKHAAKKAARQEKRRLRGEQTTSYYLSGSELSYAALQDVRSQNASQSGPGIQFSWGWEQERKKQLQTISSTIGYQFLVPTHGQSVTHGVSIGGGYSYQHRLSTWRGMQVFGGGSLYAQNYSRISPSLQNSTLANDFLLSLGLQGSLRGPVDLWLFKPMMDVSLRLPLLSFALRTPPYSFAYLEATEARLGPMGVITPLHVELGVLRPFSRWHRSTNTNQVRIAYIWDMYHIADKLSPVVFATHSFSFTLRINREFHESL